MFLWFNNSTCKIGIYLSKDKIDLKNNITYKKLKKTTAVWNWKKTQKNVWVRKILIQMLKNWNFLVWSYFLFQVTSFYHNLLF